MKSSSKIVLRVEPRDGVMAPNLLREASYRLYKVTTWYSEIAARDFTDLSSETNNTTWQLLPGKTNTSRLSIGCRLSGGRGLLALPDGSGRLENLPVIALHRNGLGAVLAEGPGALVFDACYGPGATLDSAPDGLASTNADLRVPEIEMPALDRAIEELHLTNREAALAMHAINEFFMSKFTYTLGSQYRIGVGTNFTALSYFLSRSHSGHCEYFATATVLLLRRLGIPARYAVGYAVHEASGSAYIVREGDAHAWCLVWDKKAQTWRNFDTTPASWIEEEAHRKSPLQFLSDAWFRIRIEISRFWWNQGRVRQYALWALLPVLLFLLYRIIFRRRRRDHGQSAGAASATAWPGLDSEFYQLEKKLTERGLIRGASEPMADWLRRALADPALAAFNEPLQNLLRLHYRYRFDPNGLTSNDREALGREARACLATVTQRRK
jgi:hypothetical protein